MAWVPGRSVADQERRQADLARRRGGLVVSGVRAMLDCLVRRVLVRAAMRRPERVRADLIRHWDAELSVLRRERTVLPVRVWRQLRFVIILVSARSGGGAVCAQARRLRRRLLTIAVAYAMTGLVFAAMGGFGVGLLMTGLSAFGVSWTVAGVATLAGTLAICLAALLGRAAVVRATGATTPTRAIVVARVGRILILLAAAGTATTAVLLTPVGDDERSFILTVNLIIAGALALFALVADDVVRAMRHPHPG